MAQQDGSQVDFGALFEAHQRQVKTSFQIGDRVKGTVTAIDRGSVFLDVGGRSDAIVDRAELMDREGNLTVKTGDVIEAFCVGHQDDTVRLTTRMTGGVADASLQEAYESGIPVEGRVLSERKGGYEVQVASIHGFCPYSQMDLYRKEPTAFLGEKFTFIITEYAEDGGNLVLSRRRHLEQEQQKRRQQLRETLAVDDVVEGTVTRLMNFGAFVDLGGGVEGLIHVRELGWARNLRPEDILAVGQAVTVSIINLDWDNNRIGLSLRQAQGNPWDRVSEGESGYVVGRRLTGVVTRLMPFGAFVELEPGIEGLVHISRLGAGRRINHPSEVVKEGDHVEVCIQSVDPESRRLALSIESSAAEADDRESAPEEGGAGPLRVGARLRGVVDSHRDFGVFVRLPGDQTGLLHVSQVELKGSTNTGKALYRMFPPNSELEVVIRELDGKRISLTLPATMEKEAEAAEMGSLADPKGTQLGSLADAFGGLQL